ncbi:cytochrome c oxidase subunit 7C, mitochondrial-like [Haliotis asinina]|uniref:cytochrome c oxidase subunit 7C, mitochondrial-like n=1 Tax=Haliotis asinina TaxID=109174 RepID=UPI003531FC4D
MASVGRLALSRLSTLGVKRNISTTVVRRSQAWQQEGVPGANLPFSIKNRYKLTLYFVLFFGSAFNLPFILVRHQILKK